MDLLLAIKSEEADCGCPHCGASSVTNNHTDNDKDTCTGISYCKCDICGERFTVLWGEVENSPFMENCELIEHPFKKKSFQGKALMDLATLMHCDGFVEEGGTDIF